MVLKSAMLRPMDLMMLRKGVNGAVGGCVRVG